MDCANKERMGTTDLCDGRAMYCHTCVDAATRVSSNALSIARERLEGALLQIGELKGRLKAMLALFADKRGEPWI